MRLPWLGLAITAGCIEIGLDPIESKGEPPRSAAVTETFVQAPLPRVDLLLVIDDTSSMAEEQEALANEMGALLDDLDAAGVAWQLGVVTTDMADGGLLRGSPWILTPTTPDRDEVFARTVAVGVEGGDQAGLASADLALALADGGENAGFRRDDALLHVVFVSDGDDDSEPWLEPDPVAEFLDTLGEESRRTGLPARASGLIGDTPNGCVSASGSARPATRYTRVVEGTGGVAVSICEPDFAPVVSTLAEASIEWQTEFVLREAPEGGRVRVAIDDVAVTGGFTVEDRTLIFAEPPPPEALIEVSYTVPLGATDEAGDGA